MFRSQLVLASRLARIDSPIDGVCTTMGKVEPLTAETQRARRFGFGAKLCIHPLQAGPINRCFHPTPEEIEWARRVVRISSEAKGAAVALDGKMIDRPVLLKAEAVIRESNRT